MRARLGREAAQVTITDIVVGFDGSAESDQALAWALEEARLRNAPVRAINVWQPSGSPEEVKRIAALGSVADLRESLLREVTVRVHAAVLQTGPADLAVSAQVRYGHPVKELIQAAGPDSLLVLGSRGRGSITGSMLGSVSQSAVQYATGTVVVVRGRTPDDRLARVVVGVDGSPTSVRALRFADDAARHRGASLRVIHAWSLPYVGFAGPAWSLPQETIDEIAAQAFEPLRDAMRRAGVDSGRPDVEISLVESSPALALLDAAEQADLLVVGSRGYGGWKGLLLGSVSTQCVTRSPCPVAVIRAQDGEVSD